MMQIYTPVKMWHDGSAPIVSSYMIWDWEMVQNRARGVPGWSFVCVRHQRDPLFVFIRAARFHIEIQPLDFQAQQCEWIWMNKSVYDQHSVGKAANLHFGAKTDSGRHMTGASVDNGSLTWQTKIKGYVL